MEFLKKVRNLLFIFVIVGGVTAYIDYTRMIEGENPVFCKSTYDEKAKEETCRGIFYIENRDIKQSPREKLNISSNVRYRIANQIIPIKLKSPKVTKDFVLYVTPSITCPSPSHLFYENDNQKIYLDCIASIKVKDKNQKESKDLKDALEENPSLIEDIIKNLSFTGYETDNTTEKYITTTDEFSNKKITVYRCSNNINDIYLTMNNTMAEDYCTKKNDSLPKEQE